MAKDVFISYARPDVVDARRLRGALEDAGITCWTDFDEILPGEFWKERIKDAIGKCHFFICLLSSRAMADQGYRHEEIPAGEGVRS